VAYTLEEIAFLCRTYTKHHDAGKQLVHCIAAIAARLGRSAVSVKNKIGQLRKAGKLPFWDQHHHAPGRSRFAGHRDSDASGRSDDSSNAADSVSDSDRGVEDASVTSPYESPGGYARHSSSSTGADAVGTHPSRHGSSRRKVMSQVELKNALRSLLLPDITNRRRIGAGFRHSAAEDEYILAVQELFRRVRADSEQMRDYLARKLDRSRKSIYHRFVTLRGTTRYREEKDESDSGEVSSTQDELSDSAEYGSPVRANRGPRVSGPYSADEDNTVHRMHAACMLEGKAPMRCYQEIADVLGRTVSSVKNRVKRLRDDGDIAPRDCTQGIRGSIQRSSDFRSGLTLPRQSQPKQIGIVPAMPAKTTHRVAERSSDDSLHNTDSEPDRDAHRKSLSQALSAHLGHSRTVRPESRLDKALDVSLGLGKRKREAADSPPQPWSGSSAGSDHSLQVSDSAVSDQSLQSTGRQTPQHPPPAARQTPFLSPNPPIQKRRFTIDEDAALRTGFERLSDRAIAHSIRSMSVMDTSAYRANLQGSRALRKSGHNHYKSLSEK
jgi:biotin operon repressor